MPGLSLLKDGLVDVVLGCKLEAPLDIAHILVDIVHSLGNIVDAPWQGRPDTVNMLLGIADTSFGIRLGALRSRKKGETGHQEMMEDEEVEDHEAPREDIGSSQTRSLSLSLAC